MTLLGAILAGGRSLRMGRDKAEVEISGTTLLQRVSDAMAEVADRVVLLGDVRDRHEAWPDQVAVTGPLAGVATALGRMSETRALVVAVDNPFVQVSTLQNLAAIESELPVVPVDEHGVRQVTCAIYPKQIAVQAAEEASAGGSIQTLLDRVSFLPVTPEVWEQWGEDGRSWFSVDTPERLAEGIARYV